jgi:hypothetical protein
MKTPYPITLPLRCLGSTERKQPPKFHRLHLIFLHCLPCARFLFGQISVERSGVFLVISAGCKTSVLCVSVWFDVNQFSLAQNWHCLLFVAIQGQKVKQQLLPVSTTPHLSTMFGPLLASCINKPPLFPRILLQLYLSFWMSASLPLTLPGHRKHTTVYTYAYELFNLFMELI